MHPQRFHHRIWWLLVNPCLLAASAVKTVSVCSSRQSQKAVHICRCLPLVTLQFTSTHKVMLVHLAANAIPLGQRITGQEVPQKFIYLGDCLVVNASWSICWVCPISNFWASTSSLEETVVLDLAAFWRFFKVVVSLSTALASFLHCTLSPFWLMRPRTATMWARYSLVFPWEKMDMLKMVSLGSLILRLTGASLVVTRSIGRTYWMSGKLLSYHFLALQIFQSLGALEGGTHLGVLPECGNQHESFEQRSWWNL